MSSKVTPVNSSLHMSMRRSQGLRTPRASSRDISPVKDTDIPAAERVTRRTYRAVAQPNRTPAVAVAAEIIVPLKAIARAKDAKKRAKGRENVVAYERQRREAQHRAKDVGAIRARADAECKHLYGKARGARSGDSRLAYVLRDRVGNSKVRQCECEKGAPMVSRAQLIARRDAIQAERRALVLNRRNSRSIRLLDTEEAEIGALIAKFRENYLCTSWGK